MRPVEVAEVAASAGFTGRGLVTAVAVALAESGGNPRAVGTNTDRWRSRDRGLWQINDHWHPEVSDAEAFNPATAARAAYRISKGGTDWTPWATYPVLSGAQWPSARMAVAQARRSSGGENTPVLGFHPGIPIIPPSDLIPGLPNSDGTKGPVNGLKDLIDPAYGDDSVLGVAKKALAMAVHAGVWISDSHNWGRVAMVAGGTVGALVALRMLAATGAAGSTAQAAARINPVKAAANVVPVGKAAGAVGKAAKAIK